jgi:hypothetical protein
MSCKGGTVVGNDHPSVPDYVTLDGRTGFYGTEGHFYSVLKTDFHDAIDDVFTEKNIGLDHK